MFTVCRKHWETSYRKTGDPKSLTLSSLNKYCLKQYLEETLLEQSPGFGCSFTVPQAQHPNSWAEAQPGAGELSLVAFLKIPLGSHGHLHGFPVRNPRKLDFFLILQSLGKQSARPLRLKSWLSCF